MKNFIIWLCVLCFFQNSSAQNDSLYLYFNKDWEKCNKDTATYYSIAHFNGKVWERKDYWKANNRVQMKGAFTDSSFKKKDGDFTYYYESGTVKSEAKYDTGKYLGGNYFYENGKKKAKVEFVNDKEKATGWDEDGKEIPDYIFEREAVFPGGMNGWISFLESKLNPDVPAKKGLPVGLYKVRLRFFVNKTGELENMQVIEAPNNCEACAKEAIRVMKKSPKWIPAIQFNKPVIYAAEQPIIFQVEY